MNHVEKALEKLLIEYCAHTPKSKSLIERFQEVMPGGDTRSSTYFAPYPVVLVDGHEDMLEDADGHRYVDMQNNYTSLIHGHTVRKVLQGSLTDEGIAYGGPTIHQEVLAREMCQRVASVEKVRFVNSGSEATELAIQVARAFTGRRWIVKMEGGYHGSHAIARVDAPGEHTELGEADRLGVKSVPFNDADALDAELTKLAGQCSGVLLEPVMGAAGTIPPFGSYLKDVEAICKRHEVLLILDEVQMFRLSYGGAQEIWGIQPDLTAFGKIIGGGIPIGAVGGKDVIMDVLNPNRSNSLHGGGTFNGNPLSMIAGKRSLDALTVHSIASINSNASRICDAFSGTIRKLGLPAQITICGSIFNVHWTTNPISDFQSTQSADAMLKRYFHISMLLKGVFIAARGMLNCSTALTEANTQFVIHAFEQVASEMRSLV